MSFIRLQKGNTIIELDGLLVVTKVDTKEAYFYRGRQLKLEYQSGQTVNLNYGSDNEYHHETNRKKQRDADFQQISALLVESEP